MRLDKFLKVSRLIKRRTVAKEVSNMSRVLVNGNCAKPSKELKIGDKITIEFFKNTLTVEILNIPTGNVSVQESKELYKIIEEKNNEN